LTSFNSDGFSLGTNDEANESGRTYVGWAWDAGSSTVSNTDGSVTSSVRANPSAGFSIVSYTATGSNLTVGHGLNAKPAMIWLKTRSASGDWLVMHESIGVDHFLKLNLTQAKAGPYSNVFTSVSSSTFGTGNDSGINTNGQTKIAYCFAPVAGYSAFGSYEGTGAADNFVYTGFRSRLVWLKEVDNANPWYIYDTARNTYNTIDNILQANAIPHTLSGTNRSGSTFIFCAWAENPFQANGGLAR
jgi:hypothetical protein